MSILIKGMDIPKNKPIQVVILTDGRIVSPLFGIEIADAVDVPTPHGRLTDADKLMAKIKDTAVNPVPTWVLNEILNASTIIEAED